MDPKSQRLSKVESSPIRVESTLLDRERLEARQPSLELRFEALATRYVYNPYASITEERWTRKGQEPLVYRGPLHEWTDFWNDTKGTNKSFVELNLINYCEIPWNELTNILYKSCVQYIEFLLDTEGILDGEEYTELLSGFGRFAEMYSIYQTMTAPVGVYNQVPVLSLLLRRTLSKGKIGDIAEFFQYVHARCGRALEIPANLNTLSPLTGAVARKLKACSKKEGFKKTHWLKMQEFFLDPIGVYCGQRLQLQTVYLKYLTEALCYNLMQNKLNLARTIHKLQVPPVYTGVLTREKDVLIHVPEEMPTNMFTRAEQYGRLGENLFITLIRLGAEEVVLAWLEESKGRESGRSAALRVYCDGDCGSLLWNEAKTMVEVFKFGDTPPAQRVMERVEWKLNAGYEPVTALQVAFEVSNPRIVEALLEHSANPFMRGNVLLRGFFALKFSATLNRAQQDTTSLQACKEELFKVVNKRLSNQAKPMYESAQEWWEKIQLLEAARFGKLKVLDKFIGEENRSLRTVPLNTSQRLDRGRLGRSLRSLGVSRSGSLGISMGQRGSTFTKGASNRSLIRTRTMRMRKLQESRAQQPKSLKVCGSTAIVNDVVEALDQILYISLDLINPSQSVSLRAIGNLLRVSDVFLNSHRYRQIGLVVQRALETNGPGDESAVQFLLYECEMLDILLDKNNIQSVSKYTRPIYTLINNGNLRKVNKSVLTHKTEFKAGREEAQRDLLGNDLKMALNGELTTEEENVIKALDSERTKTEFSSGEKFSESNMLLAIAKKGQYQLLRLYIEEGTEGAEIDPILLHTVAACAVAHDHLEIVRYLVLRDIDTMGLVVRKVLFHTGLHIEILEMLMEVAKPTSETEVENLLFGLFTAQAKRFSPRALDTIAAALVVGPDNKLSKSFTARACEAALERAFTQTGHLNAPATNSMLQMAILQNYKDLISATMLDLFVEKAIAFSKPSIAGPDTYFKGLFETLRNACRDRLGSSLKRRCETLERMVTP